jgi:hypothetical protein
MLRLAQGQCRNVYLPGDLDVPGAQMFQFDIRLSLTGVSIAVVSGQWSIISNQYKIIANR